MDERDARTNEIAIKETEKGNEKVTTVALPLARLSVCVCVVTFHIFYC